MSDNMLSEQQVFNAVFDENYGEIAMTVEASPTTIKEVTTYNMRSAQQILNACLTSSNTIRVKWVI